MIYLLDCGILYQPRCLIKIMAFNRATVMATVIMVAVILLVQTFASHRPGRSLTLEVSNMIWSSIIQPASFYVAHVNYFGPLVIVCTILWKHVCNVSHSLGVGFSLVMAIGFALSIGSGSRHLMNFVPFFILCTVIAVEDLKWRARQYLLTVVC
jgi:hypothetical protein